MRVNITLECTSCKERNYLTNKNKRNNPDRLEKMKYCPRERKVTLHKEVHSKVIFTRMIFPPQLRSVFQDISQTLISYHVFIFLTSLFVNFVK